MVSFAEWLDNELKQRKWSRADLARLTGKSETMFSLIYKGTRNPGASTCKVIAKALNLPEEAVLRAAGLLSAQMKTNPLIDAIIYEANELPRDEQEELLEYVRLRRERSKNKTRSNIVRRTRGSESV